MARDTTNSDARYQLAVASFQQGRSDEAIARLREIIAVDPRHARTHRLLGLLLRRQNRLGEALACLDRAIECQPDLTAAYGERGDVLMDLGRPQDAIASYDQAVTWTPGSFGDWCNRGAALDHLGRYEDAVSSFDQAIKLNPDFAQAYFNRANALTRLARHEQAIADYDRALAIDPSLSDALNNRGSAFRALGHHEEALASYQTALQINPRLAMALSNMGGALRALERMPEAIRCYEQAIALDPDLLEPRHNLGNALAALDRHLEAIVQYRDLLTRRPDHIDARLNLASSHLALDQVDEAIEQCEAALALDADCAAAHYNMGNALLKRGRDEATATHFQRAIALNPDFLDAYNNLGLVLDALERPAEAIAVYDRAMAINPDFAVAPMNKGLILLSLGRFAEGWELLEYRHRATNTTRRAYSQPRWDGGRVKGTLLAWGDQGLGDQIIYSSMVPELAERADQVVVEVEPRLVPLFARSFVNVQTVALGAGSNLYTGRVDAQEALSDLGRHLRKQWQDFSRDHQAYLRADAARASSLRARLSDTARTVIGLSWISVNKVYGRSKSARLRDFEALLNLPDCRFVDLQYGDTSHERAAVEREMGVRVERLPDIDNTADIDGLAALITALDAVLTVSNTTAHLAGALGRPTWVMVPHGHARFWYWFRGNGNSPWYPSVRVRRQRPGQSWASLVHSVTQEIQDFRAGIERSQ